MEPTPVSHAYEYSSAMSSSSSETASNHSAKTNETKNESSESGKMVDVKA